MLESLNKKTLQTRKGKAKVPGVTVCFYAFQRRRVKGVPYQIGIKKNKKFDFIR